MTSDEIHINPLFAAGVRVVFVLHRMIIEYTPRITPTHGDWMKAIHVLAVRAYQFQPIFVICFGLRHEATQSSVVGFTTDTKNAAP
jgi:hypothetical protein